MFVETFRSLELFSFFQKKGLFLNLDIARRSLELGSDFLVAEFFDKQFE